MADAGRGLPLEPQGGEAPGGARRSAKGTRAYPKRRLAPRSGRRGHRAEVESKRMGMHWYFLGLLFLLVAGLFIVTLQRLPRVGHDPPHGDATRYLRPPRPASPHVEPQHSQPLPLPWLQAAPQGGAAAQPAPLEEVVGPVQPAATRAPGQLSSAAKEWAAQALQAERAAAALPSPGQPPHTGGAQPDPRKAAARGGVAVFEGDSWLQVPMAADSDELIFSAWIFVPQVPMRNFPSHSPSSKTIASTKVASCQHQGDLSTGWSLYVHEVGTVNGKLCLTWTAQGSACNQMCSPEKGVPFDKWTMVGFSLSKEAGRGSARLFVGGQIVADSAQHGAVRRGGGTVDGSEAALRREVHSGRGMLCLGAFCQSPPAPVVKDPRAALAALKQSRAKPNAKPHPPPPPKRPPDELHVFVGLLGDVRLLTGLRASGGPGLHAGSAPQELERLLLGDTQELIASAAIRREAVALQVQFHAGAEPTHLFENLADGSPLDCKAGGGQEDDARVSVQAWSESPRHPLTGDTGLQAGPPGLRLEPGALRATWPEAWVKAHGEAALRESQREADSWADEVRDAMRHTWAGYRMRAWGRDEVKPVSGKPKDWCRLAITMLDGLSTLWVMGLHQEFDEAADYLVKNPMPSKGKHGLHSVFEINIRALGGLLSAYSLSGKGVFLDTAKRLGDVLLGAFRTENGLPNAAIDVGTGESGRHTWQKKKGNIILAEPTTLQVEFRYLSHATGNPAYREAADKAMRVVMDAVGQRGIVPIYLSSSAKPAFAGKKISFGAMGDSYYEYLLKQWLQSGKKENKFKDMWKHAIKDMISELVVKTKGGRTFVAEKNNGKQVHRMDHLACFVGGMLMLGSRTLPTAEVDPYWETLAAEIGETCYEMYRRMPTGLSPEYVLFKPEASGEKADMVTPQDAPHNLLRPEAIETLYYLHYYTGDPKYRRWAYEMFSAFQKHCKTRFGYSAVADVRKVPATFKDSQESFWLAETLKYFYLIFAPRNALSLEEFILNTEAQPMRMWS